MQLNHILNNIPKDNPLILCGEISNCLGYKDWYLIFYQLLDLDFPETSNIPLLFIEGFLLELASDYGFKNAQKISNIILKSYENIG